MALAYTVRTIDRLLRFDTTNADVVVTLLPFVQTPNAPYEIHKISTGDGHTVTIQADPTTTDFLLPGGATSIVLDDTSNTVYIRIPAGGVSPAFVTWGGGGGGGTGAATVAYGTHAARPAPAGVVNGSVYVETDRNEVIYQSQAGAWHYCAGTMWGTLSPDQRPTDLGVNDAAFTYRTTDEPPRMFIWSGTAWVETTPGTGASVAYGTHAARPTTAADAAIYVEQDRNGVIYQYQGGAWHFLAGTMWGTISPDNRPTGLGPNDAGFAYHTSSAPAREWIWSGYQWIETTSGTDSYGAHGARPAPSTVADGSVYIEQDRDGLIYQSQGGAWHFLAGTMWGTMSPDLRPTDLGVNDAGFTYRTTDAPPRAFVWSGTAWVETTPSGSGGASVTYGTHGARPASTADAALYIETDRNELVYQFQAGTWHFCAGTMWGTMSPDNRPTDLGANDAGLVYRTTDLPPRQFVWGGAAGWVETTPITGGASLIHPNVGLKVGPSPNQIVEGSILDEGVPDSGNVHIYSGGNVDATCIRATGYVPAATGQGVELDFTGGNGYIVSYDRGAGVYRQLAVSGAPLVLTGQSSPSGAILMQANHEGNVGVGTAVPDSLLTVDGNASPLQAPPAGSVLHVGGADGAVSRIVLDGYGTNPNVTLRECGGTAAAPTPSTVNVALGALTFWGRGATGYSSGARASINGYAAENWTDSAQGSYFSIFTTALGTTGTVEKVRVDPAGNVGINTTNPLFKLMVTGDSNAVSSQPFGDWTNNGQVAITGLTNNSLRLGMGVDTTIPAGVIQAINAGVTALPLLLNPNAGNVGIGLTNPKSPLDVHNPNALVAAIITGSDPGAVGIGSVSGAGFIQAYTDHTAATAASLALQPSAGYTGIGTANPASILDIHYPGTFSNAPRIQGSQQSALHFTSASGGPGFGIGRSANATDGQDFWIYDAAAGLFRVQITSTGNVGVGTSTPDGQLHVASGITTSITAETTGGYYSQFRLKTNAGTYQMSVGANGTGPFQGAWYVFNEGNSSVPILVSPAGNVGIANASPAHTLDVTGSFACSSDGAVGGVLKVGAGTPGQPGDIGIARTAAPTTGTIYFGNTGTIYIYWDGSKFNFSGPINFGSTYVNGSLTVHEGTNQNVVFAAQGGNAGFSALNDAFNTPVPMEYAASGHYFVGGPVGIGTTAPYQGFSVVGANPTDNGTSLQMSIGEQSNNSGYRLMLGYNNLIAGGNWAGVIQAISAGAAGPLQINPNGGNVGIGFGTTNPSHLLDVNGSFRATNANVDQVLIVGSAGVGANNGDIAFARPANNNTACIFFGATGNHFIYFDGGTFQFAGNGNFSGNLAASGATPNFTASTAGSLGGTIEVIDSGGAVGSGGGIMLTGGNGAWRMAGIKAYATNGGGNSQGDLIFYTRRNATDAGFSEAMHITAGGNVGINNSGPTRTLDLGGNFHCTSGAEVDGVLKVGAGTPGQPGDIGLARTGAPGTGTIYFGNTAGQYIYFDGTTFQHSAGALFGGPTDVNGVLRCTGATPPTTGVGVEITYASGSGFLQAYDRGASAYKPLLIGASAIELYGGNVSIGTGAPAAHQLQLSADDAFKPSTSTWGISSGAAVKQNVKELQGGLEIINKIRPIEAEYNGKHDTPKGQRVVSIIAEEIREVLPHTVTEDADGVLGFNPHEIIFQLILAVKELSKEVEELKAKAAKAA